MTKSAWVVRTPRLTVCRNSDDLVIRCRVGNTDYYPRPKLGGQFAAALATPAGNDRATSASPHAQPETVGARATPIVWLEGPLALCHRYYSFMSVTFSAAIAHDVYSRHMRCAETQQPLVLLTRHRRGTYGILGFIPDDVRVAAVPPTFGRLFEGTDLLGAGQTDHRRHTRIPPSQQSVIFNESCHRCVRIGWRAATKTVSFCECRFHRAHASEPPALADADRGRTPTSRSPGTGDPT